MIAAMIVQVFAVICYALALFTQESEKQHTGLLIAVFLQLMVIGFLLFKVVELLAGMRG